MHEHDTSHPYTQYFKTWARNSSCNFPERMKSQKAIFEYNILISKYYHHLKAKDKTNDFSTSR